MRCPPTIAALLLCACAVGLPIAAGAVPSSPKGGCPMPPNALVITEFMPGQSGEPRWVEIHNPGKYTISLDKVWLAPQAANGKSLPLPAFHLGALLPELPAGDYVAFGHVPQTSTPQLAYLKTKVAELGASFVLPCKAKLLLDGPSGPVDHVAYDLCNEPKPPVMELDPGLLDTCKNDDLSTWCAALGDLAGIGTPAKANAACDLDGDGYSSLQGDCDDQLKAVFPGAVEVCNGLDDDCNGQTDENLMPPPGTCLDQGVCKGPLPGGMAVAKCDGAGGFTCTYPFGYESVSETLCDGFDNDCDGQTDEALRNPCGTCGPLPAEVCDGFDNDCDGQTDEEVSASVDCGKLGLCSEGKPICKAGQPACAYPLAWEATETLCDTLDNDCDGETDEELGLKTACTVGTGACAGQGEWICGPGGKPTCNGQERKPGAELCGDGLDNDCDGNTDEDFHVGGQKVGAQCEAGTGVCRVVGKVVCSPGGKAAQCNVQAAEPDQDERCGNDLDDDCDGQTDEQGCKNAGDSGFSCTSAPSHGRWGWGLAFLPLLALTVWRRWRPRPLTR